jgi:hypothetical protein
MALFPYNNTSGIYISAVGKSDGDSIDNGRDLIFDPITEELIRRLFEETNFNSFTFNSDVSLKNEFFEVSYSPYYLLADLYLFNPAFPEISLHLVNRESLNISSGLFVIGNESEKDELKLSLGGRVTYYKHESANAIFSLFDLSFNKPEELIRFENTYGVSADFSAYLDNPTQFIPNLSFQLKNIGSEVKDRGELLNSATRLAPRFLFETYATFGLGKEFQTQFGSFAFNIEAFVEGYLQSLDTADTTLGAYYTLKLFSLFLGVGKYYQNVGLSFDSENFNVGIAYTREKDIKQFQQSFEKSAYIGLTISL